MKNLISVKTANTTFMNNPDFSYGRMWKRSEVEWAPNAKVLGAEHHGANPIDFQDQTGIYVLHNGEQVVHASRTDSLGASLYAHTRGPDQWDHFTWFGLRPVGKPGELGQQPESIRSDDLSHLYQAILIIALNPPLNTAEDLDGLKLVEYVQPSS
jgi:hypothetical protein